MKKKLQWLLTVWMAGVLLCTSMVSVCAVSPDVAGVSPASASDGISTYLTNCDTASFAFNVVDPGEATFLVTYIGRSSTFVRAKLTVQVQKRFLGSFWRNVGDEWVGYCTDLTGRFYDYVEVSGTGTYRALFTLEIEGSTGVTDVMEDSIDCQYS